MVFNYSILKNFNQSFLNNVDFKNPDNLAFLVISSVIVIIVLVILVVIIVNALSLARRTAVKMFNINIKKINLKKVKKENSSPWSEAIGEIRGGDSLPKQKNEGGNITNNFSTEKKEEVEKQKDAVKTFKEKEEKSISEHLGKLKVDKDGDEKDTLASKMPSREDKTEEDDKHAKIKIQVPKHFTTSGMASADLNRDGDKRVIVATDHDSRSLLPKKELPKEASKAAEVFVNDQAHRSLVPEKKTSQLNPKEAKKNTVAPVTNSDSMSPVSEEKITEEAPKNDKAAMFEDKSGVSRMKLEQKLKRDPKIWQAGKNVGLNLSPLERAKLMKEVFSPVYGRDISKTDLKWSIKKLNQKMLSTKDPQEHAKIRKEIAFFKNIGNIKD